jgi:hypothetical protein
VSQGLEAALERSGLSVRVEIRDGLAVLIPRDSVPLLSDSQRRAAVAAAAQHGFTHVALELVD